MVTQDPPLNIKHQDALTMLTSELFSGPISDFNRLGIRTLIGKKLTQIGAKHRFDVSLGGSHLVSVDFLLDASGIAIVIDNGHRQDSLALCQKIKEITQINNVNALLVITTNNTISIPECLNSRIIQLFILNSSVPKKTSKPPIDPTSQGVPLNLLGSLRRRFFK